MNTMEPAVQVTLLLPKKVYERVAQTALAEQRDLEDLLSQLVAEGLDTHATVRELFEQASAQYRTRLGREGKLSQSSEEVLQEL